MDIEHNLREGMSANEARRQAIMKLGGLEQTKEAYAERRGFVWLSSLPQDLRLSVRMLRKSVGFTIVAVSTLAIAIGANTTIFSVIDALLLRNLPVARPERLVQISEVQGGRTLPLTFPMFDYIRQHQQVFSGVFGWYGDGLFPVRIGQSESFDDVWAVTGNIYSQLGISPFLGRLMVPSDADPANGSPGQVAVLGYEFWQRQFDGDSNVVGRTIIVNGYPFIVIGVTPAKFSAMSAVAAPEITVPITAIPLLTGGRLNLTENNRAWLSIGGRLRDGVSIRQALAQVKTFWPELLAATLPPGNSGKTRQRLLAEAEVSSIATGTAMSLRATFSQQLLMLMGMVALLLVAACLNLANLMLARAAARSRELSVRAAIGASRSRLIRQMASESLLLGGLGALLGLFLAIRCDRPLIDYMTQYYQVPPALNLSPDLRVFAVTTMAAVLAGLLCATAPAWMAARTDPARALQQSARGFSRSTGKIGKALVIVQVALSMVLLVGAGLLTRSLHSLQSQPLGFNQRGLASVVLYPRTNGSDEIDVGSYYRELLRRVLSIQGVRGASWTAITPGRIAAPSDYVFPAGTFETSRRGVPAAEGFISPGFFSTVEVPLIAGRDFSWADNDRSGHVAILNSRLARNLFPTGNAVGQFIHVGSDPNYEEAQVVGIVNDGRLLDIRDSQSPAIYLAILQNPLYSQPGTGNLLVRLSGNSQEVIAAVRQQIEALGRELAFNIRTVQDISAQTLLPERTMAFLSGCFALAALLLCIIGLYGLLSYAVSGRTREIGIRVALGAQRADILRSVLREGLLLVAVGVAIGLPCALAATRVIQSVIFGISSVDFATFALVIGTLASVGIVASYIPAQRAMRVDPMAALRNE